MKKELALGIFLAVTFLIVLAVMLTPSFSGINFIQYADSKFNQYSKHSSYFIPEITKNAEKYTGKSVALTVIFENEEDAEKAAKIYSQVADVKLDGKSLTIRGDLGAIFSSVLKDADEAYWNNEKYFNMKYGMSAKETLYFWYVSLEDIAKSLEEDRRFDESIFLETQIITRVVEPAYNFYGIEPVPMVLVGVLLLVFYVIYTLWWGFAIYYVLEGVGIKITKAKARKGV